LNVISTMLKELAVPRAGSVSFFDGAALQGTSLKREPSDWNAGDVVHPNAKGQEKFARFWYTAISELIAQHLLPTTP
jgi:lysophospholipase L1-like esterase